MMEKYGVEVEKPESNELNKYGETKCFHPPEGLKVDGMVRFCTKCNMYLKQGV
jgi:hypothetical protein